MEPRSGGVTGRLCGAGRPCRSVNMTGRKNAILFHCLHRLLCFVCMMAALHAAGPYKRKGSNAPIEGFMCKNQGELGPTRPAYGKPPETTSRSSLRDVCGSDRRSKYNCLQEDKQQYTAKTRPTEQGFRGRAVHANSTGSFCVRCATPYAVAACQTTAFATHSTSVVPRSR